VSFSHTQNGFITLRKNPKHPSNLEFPYLVLHNGASVGRYRNIKEAAKKALDEGWTHYVPSPGIPDLRDAIAEYIGKTRGLKLTRDNVCVTSGAKPIILFTLLTLVNPGDEVIYPNPGFPIYESCINFVGAKAVPLPLREERNFRFDCNELEKLLTKKTKLLILNSPQNPTGGVLASSDIKRVAELAQKHDFYILSDEVYDQMLYDGHKFESIASLPGMFERTVILNGFSKTYAMTGWRVGYGVAHPSIISYFSRLNTNIDSCTCAFNQRACIEALKGPQDDSKAMIRKFDERRKMFVKGLNEIEGFRCVMPLGAFYSFPNVEEAAKMCKMDFRTLADKLLDIGGVACLAGTCFGQYGAGFIRFSYANSEKNLTEALNRIADTLKKLKK
ncbi:MAG: pyridoxal phosphate-dependent aminotransferase, partial [Planctomycetota bacterium]|nr:pyridoxal phosphate-dependent aminotransferase [Planctomycetota bacterium]